jgi:hypothetical protein
MANMGLLPITAVLAIVVIMSAYSGFWYATTPYLTVIFMNMGYTVAEYAGFFVSLSIMNLSVGLFLGILDLLVGYYSGKQYKLTMNSLLILIVVLVIAVFVGSSIGYVIAQIRLPQYPVLNLVSFAFSTAGLVSYPILWSMVGIVAGNYKRELESKVVGIPPVSPESK